jgi:hypothetical protein
LGTGHASMRKTSQQQPPLPVWVSPRDNPRGRVTTDQHQPLYFSLRRHASNNHCYRSGPYHEATHLSLPLSLPFPWRLSLTLEYPNTPPPVFPSDRCRCEPQPRMITCRCPLMVRKPGERRYGWLFCPAHNTIPVAVAVSQ